MNSPINHPLGSYLEERLNHLEGVERFVIDSLELAASLGDFQNSITRLQDVTTILEETGIKVQSLIPFETVAFFLVDEESNYFTLRHIDSGSHRAYIQGEVDHSIDEGIFAWALREKRPVVVPTQDHQKSLVLHSMATATRIRGMFVGLLNNDMHSILNVSLSLVSFVLFSSANAIESFELYRKIREIKINLERIDNYQLLFEAAPDGVEVLDAGGTIIHSNESQQKLLGYSQGQLTGSLSSDYFSEKSRGALWNHPSTLQENGYWEGEIELVTATGEPVPVWRKEKAIYDKEHRFIGAVVFNRDLTKRKQAEEEKRALMERLQRSEKMEALGQLAGGVAHDLNNVLGIMSGYSELLLEEIPEGHRGRVHVEKIFQSTDKGAAIIQDLLTLARRGVTAAEVINLNGIVADFLKTPVFEKMKDYHPRVNFRTVCDGNLLNIKGSPVHLEKTLMNLVSNAAESISGGGEVTIRTESRYLDKPIQGYDDVQEGDYAVLTISDTGMGIPPKDREKIFEPFYTKKTMGRSGTGLGLAIVWGTVKDHNGYIDVRTGVGEGTTFTLYFPATREDLIAPKLKEPVERYLGQGESVLVIDDIAEQREIVSRLLTRLGYRVHSVSGGEKAVEYLREHEADILVLDMIMAPGIDGLETYKRVLAIHPQQKAIIVSGFYETERVREAQRLGAGAYVKKPYVLERIGVAIRDELHRI
jgi:PAS domain S-box-containing protein